MISRDGNLPILSVNDGGEALVGFEGDYPFFGTFQRRLSVSTTDTRGLWTAPEVIWRGSREVTGPGSPSVLLSDSGEGVVAWSDDDGGSLYSLRPPGGGFSPPRPFDAPTYGFVHGLVDDGQGNMAALFLLRANGERSQDTLLIAWRRAGEPEFGPAKEVLRAHSVGAASLLFVENDIPILIFDGSDGGQSLRRVYTSVGTFDGEFGAPVVISNPARSAGGARPVQVRSNPRGDVLVGWIVGLGEHFEVTFRRPGEPFRPVVELGANLASIDVALALDRDGDAMATWYENEAGTFGVPRLAVLGGGEGQFTRLSLPPDFFTTEPMAYDSLGTLVGLGQTVDEPPAPGTWTVLPDGRTFGAGDRIAPPGFEWTGPFSQIGFDDRGRGWAAWMFGQEAGTGVVAVPYDGRGVSARRPPEITRIELASTARATSFAPKPRRGRARAIRFVASKTAVVSLKIMPLRKPRGRPLTVTSRAQPGENVIRLKRRQARRLVLRRRYRGLVTARDSLGQRVRKEFRFRG